MSEAFEQLKVLVTGAGELGCDKSATTLIIDAAIRDRDRIKLLEETLGDLDFVMSELEMYVIRKDLRRMLERAKGIIFPVPTGKGVDG